MVNSSSQLPSQGRDSVVLSDLTRETLRVLLPATVAVAWCWLSGIVFLGGAHLANAYLVLLVVMVSALAVPSLYEQHLRLATGIYLASLTLAISIVAVYQKTSQGMYLYLLLIIAAGMLTRPVALGLVSLVAVSLGLAIGLAHLELRPAELTAPVLLMLLTGLTSWLGTRRLFTALDWAMTMTDQAQRNEREARERRAEVRSVLKSLEEAYVRLERSNEALLFAREAAQKAYQFKASFVASVSHELRTPLNLIVGFSEMMALSPESYRGAPLPGEYRGDVMSIYRSAKHLSSLINDVLDLSQIEAGRLGIVREQVNLGELILEVMDMVQSLAKAKGLRIEVNSPESPTVLLLDRTRIRQVLLNLLTNAMRFTDRGFVRVTACQSGAEMRVTVEDSGRGIAPDRIAHAFKTFSQLDEDAPREGSGLGLAVSRRFIELHGGSMWLESTLGVGTKVTFSLPLSVNGTYVAPTVIKTGPLKKPARQGLRVVLLQDDGWAVSLLRRYVDGFDFVLARSSAQLAEAFRAGSVAAVVVDASWVSDQSGVLTRDCLRQGVPVLTCPLPSLSVLGRPLGAADYVPKPVTRESLLTALSRLNHPAQTVLVVDDDPDVVRLVSRMLRLGNPAIEVLEAANGREALIAMRDGRPDVVLLDLLMPEMDGYSLLTEMHHDDGISDTPVIIMSAHLDTSESITLQGQFTMERQEGFTVTEIVQSVGALLHAVTPSTTAAQRSA